MKDTFKRFSKLLILTLTLFFSVNIVLPQSGIAYAEQSQVDQELRQQKLDNAAKEALSASTPGPAKIALNNQGVLALPAGYRFIPFTQAANLMQVMGNEVGTNFIGMIVSKNNDLRWFITVDYNKAGYIRDEEAKNWDANALLKSIKEDNEEENKERASKGIPTSEILGWIQTPTYDAAKHQLLWSMRAKDSGKDANTDNTINYNTYALGREGYFVLDLVTSESAIDVDKFDANKIISSLSYYKGKRYEDFNKQTDHIAEYGLAALVTGVVANKLGLLGLAGVFILKIWKLLALGILVMWSSIQKFFKKVVG